jgi:hypothetical protein
MATQIAPRYCHPRLSILQFNCGNANQKSNRAILDALDPEVTQVVALQEPGFNRFTRSTYYPKGFHLLYQPEEATRVCFLVSKRLSLRRWRHRVVSHDAGLLVLDTEAGEIAILNIYNPGGQGSARGPPSCLADIRAGLDVLEEGAQLLLLGDFNLHHPHWGGPFCELDTAAEPLIELLEQEGLGLLTPPGEVTWERGRHQSTIDLTFATECIRHRLLRCQPVREAAINKDHFPIVIDLDIATHAQPPPQRFRIKNVNQDKLLAGLRESLQEVGVNQPQTAEDVETRFADIQGAIIQTLTNLCPPPRPSPKARPEWSPTCTALLRDLRRARREDSASHSEESAVQLKRARNHLKRELRKNSRDSWRLFLEDINRQGDQQRMWRMSRWARERAGKPVTDPHLVPPLKDPNVADEFAYEDNRKAQLLAGSFFPRIQQIDASDMTKGPPIAFDVDPEVTQEEVLGVLGALPDRAPGPDMVPNRALRVGREALAPYLAPVLTAACRLGCYPQRLGSHSITLAIRKEGKDDLTLPENYRPITLENTLAKVVEAVITVRVTREVEGRHMLPESQMGARSGRSTLTALGHLDETIRTAWKAAGSPITSLLSLDIKGAFPHTSHPRLLYILQQKGFPEWIIRFVQGFLSGRTTEIRFGGYSSPAYSVPTGMPQGSPLSPILFLLFISELHRTFENGRTRGIAFVDDTNIITTSRSIPENCRRLERAHELCLHWARRHGVQFAPKKYKLVHFTKSRTTLHLDHPIRIQGFDGQPCNGLRVLGLWVDKGLTYKKHVQRAAQAGMQKLYSTLRVTQSTWGLAFRQVKQIYSAVIRPTLVYAAPIWCKDAKGSTPAALLVEPLRKVHAQAVRRILGAYRAASAASLEHEAGVPPLGLYLDRCRIDYAQKAAQTEELEFLEQQRERLWQDLARRRRRERPRNTILHPQSKFIPQARHEQDPDSDTAQKRMLRAWKERWDAYRAGKKAPVYGATWLQPPKLYGGLSRAQVSLLAQLRTEAIGLNDFLSRRSVPGVYPPCECAWPRQTPKHIVAYCPLLPARESMWAAAGTLNYRVVLSTKRGVQAVTEWLLGLCNRQRLPQFTVARELHRKEPVQGAPLEQWWDRGETW